MSSLRTFDAVGPRAVSSFFSIGNLVMIGDSRSPARLGTNGGLSAGAIPGERQISTPLLTSSNGTVRVGRSGG